VHLVQVLLPLRDNNGAPFPGSAFAAVRAELTDRFGGLTAYSRVPAEGLFSDADGHVLRDDIVVFEVMCDALDDAFWAEYRKRLMSTFAQEDLVIRALETRRL